MGRTSWLKREARVGSALLELWDFFFFKDACKGIFIWASEGEAGGVLGGY